MSHSAAGLIRNVLGVSGERDSGLSPTQINSIATVINQAGATLDSATEDADSGTINAASMHADIDIKLKVASTIQQWVETDDLDDGESLADRLLMMMVGIADANQDGELDDDENAVLEAALEYSWDYLAEKGVSDEDCSLLLNDWDAEAATRISDMVVSSLPDGEDASDADVDSFAFGDDDQASAFDSVTLDAVYKKMMAIRHGKKVRINKRISGQVRLSAKQKVGIRKAQMKSHSAKAVMRRMKSRTLGRRMGM